MSSADDRYHEAATQALANEQNRIGYDEGFYMDRTRQQLAEHEERMRPSYLYRPALSVDGNKWCALYGDNLQDGVAGFGDSPAEAYADFDAQWTRKLSVSPDASKGER